MPRVLLVISGLASISLCGWTYSPVLWSPDAHWVAYTVAVRSCDEVMPPGWLFDGVARRDRRGWYADRPLSGVAYRLWATRVDTGESILLEQGRGPLTS